MAWRIERWGPPFEGGWMNWPAGLINRIERVHNVYQAHKNYASFGGNIVQFTQSQPDSWNVITYVMKLREQLSG